MAWEAHGAVRQVRQVRQVLQVLLHTPAAGNTQACHQVVLNADQVLEDKLPVAGLEAHRDCDSEEDIATPRRHLEDSWEVHYLGSWGWPLVGQDNLEDTDLAHLVGDSLDLGAADPVVHLVVAGCQGEHQVKGLGDSLEGWNLVVDMEGMDGLVVGIERMAVLEVVDSCSVVGSLVVDSLAVGSRAADSQEVGNEVGILVADNQLVDNLVVVLLALLAVVGKPHPRVADSPVDSWVVDILGIPAVHSVARQAPQVPCWGVRQQGPCPADRLEDIPMAVVDRMVGEPLGATQADQLAGDRQLVALHLVLRRADPRLWADCEIWTSRNVVHGVGDRRCR